MSLHIDRDNTCCSRVGSLRWVPACFVCSLLAKFGPWWGAPRNFDVHACAVMVPVQHPGELWYWLQNTPKPLVSAQSCVWSCKASSAGWWRFHFSSLSSPMQKPCLSLLVAFTGGDCVFCCKFSISALSTQGVGDRAFMGTCAEMSPGLWCSHNPVLLLSLRSVGLVQKDVFSGFGWEGGDWNGSDSGTLRFGTNLPKSVIVQ